jgi:hypothetical protein
MVDLWIINFQINFCWIYSKHYISFVFLALFLVSQEIGHVHEKSSKLSSTQPQVKYIHNDSLNY